MTYPPTAFCMGCHQTIAADRPSIQKLAEFAASGKPVPWVRVYQVPDYVFWQHGSPPDGVWIPEQGVTPYRGRA